MRCGFMSLTPKQRLPAQRDKARPTKVYLSYSERLPLEEKAEGNGLALGVFADCGPWHPQDLRSRSRDRAGDAEPERRPGPIGSTFETFAFRPDFAGSTHYGKAPASAEGVDVSDKSDNAIAERVGVLVVACIFNNDSK
jgi:hypothetical protein